MYTYVYMSNDLSQYKNLYLQTARDLLITLKKNKQIIDVKQQDKKALEEIHRAAHSLKSQSLVMGYPKLGLLNKELEVVFYHLKDGSLEYSRSMCEIIDRALTCIAYSLDRIEKNNTEGDITQQIEEVDTIIQLSYS